MLLEQREVKGWVLAEKVECVGWQDVVRGGWEEVLIEEDYMVMIMMLSRWCCCCCWFHGCFVVGKSWRQKLSWRQKYPPPACIFGIFFVAVPSSFLGAKKEREKKGESSWSTALSLFFILHLRSCRMQIIVATLLLYYCYIISLKYSCLATSFAFEQESRMLVFWIIKLELNYYWYDTNTAWTLFHACQLLFLSDCNSLQPLTVQQNWLFVESRIFCILFAA